MKKKELKKEFRKELQEYRDFAEQQAGQKDFMIKSFQDAGGKVKESNGRLFVEMPQIGVMSNENKSLIIKDLTGENNALRDALHRKNIKIDKIAIALNNAWFDFVSLENGTLTTINKKINQFHAALTGYKGDTVLEKINDLISKFDNEYRRAEKLQREKEATNMKKKECENWCGLAHCDTNGCSHRILNNVPLSQI